MSFTRSLTNVDVHKNMPDYPSNEGYTAAALKEAFDSPAVGLKEDITRLENELEAATSATNLGADDIYEGDSTDGNIQAKLAHLHEEIQGVSQGNIPDRTIAKIKLTSDFADSIPTNSNLGKLYLATQYRTPSMQTNPTPISYTIPALTTNNKQGYTLASACTADTDDCGQTNITDLYTMFNGNGSGYLWLSTSTARTKTWQLTLSCPLAIKLSRVTASGINVKLIVEGSKDNLTWVELGNASGKDITISVSNTNYYKYFKLIFSKAEYDSYARLKNSIVLQGVSISSLNVNSMSIEANESNELLNNYVTGQIVKITTPVTYLAGNTFNSTLNIYGLGAKAVPTDLQPNTRYSLVYDGTNFVHE